MVLADGVMLDLGGGSMQLVHVVGRHARELDSWPLGAVRVTERFLAEDRPPKPKQLREQAGAAFDPSCVESLGRVVAPTAAAVAAGAEGRLVTPPAGARAIRAA